MNEEFVELHRQWLRVRNRLQGVKAQGGETGGAPEASQAQIQLLRSEQENLLRNAAAVMAAHQASRSGQGLPLQPPLPAIRVRPTAAPESDAISTPRLILRTLGGRRFMAQAGVATVFAMDPGSLQFELRPRPGLNFRFVSITQLPNGAYTMAFYDSSHKKGRLIEAIGDLALEALPIEFRKRSGIGDLVSCGPTAAGPSRCRPV